MFLHINALSYIVLGSIYYNIYTHNVVSSTPRHERDSNRQRCGDRH
jgi:hypothetical protein